jgi:2-dehydro-3-deoxyglucarate aldolase
MKNLRESLKNGNSIVGTWLNSGSPVIAELMSAVGFDFVCVDVEHSAVDLPQTQVLFQAIASGNPHCAPLVRLHGVDYAFVKRYLDAGARGVIGPLVNTADQAKTLVCAVKYPPEGDRGVGFCRANQYGLNIKTEIVNANEEILVVVQIEHIEGVRNIDEILSVPGVDAVFIGPYDLTASMGIAAQFDHPDYGAALATVMEACHRHDIVAGIHVVEPDASELCERRKEGYRLLAYSLDITMVMRVAQSGLSAIRKKIPLQK